VVLKGLRGLREEWEGRGWRGERERIGGREPVKPLHTHPISKRGPCRNLMIFSSKGLVSK